MSAVPVSSAAQGASASVRARTCPSRGTGKTKFTPNTPRDSLGDLKPHKPQHIKLFHCNFSSVFPDDSLLLGSKHVRLGNIFAPFKLARARHPLGLAECPGVALDACPRRRPHASRPRGDSLPLSPRRRRRLTPSFPEPPGLRLFVTAAPETAPIDRGALAEGPTLGAGPRGLASSPRERARTGRGRCPFRGAAATAASAGRLPTPPPAALGDASPITARGEPQPERGRRPRPSVPARPPRRHHEG